MLPRRTMTVGPCRARTDPGRGWGRCAHAHARRPLGCVRAKIAYPCTSVKSATTERPGLSRVPAFSARPELAWGGVARGHLLPGPQKALGITGGNVRGNRVRRGVGLGC